MAVVATRMILTPTFDDTKRMTVQGSVAVYEKVAVTVVGVAENGVVPAGLVLRLVSQGGRIEYARFPAELTDAWTGSNSDATCVLDLNTPALRGYFRQLCDDAVCEAGVNLENGTTDNLYGVGRTVIRNWIQNALSPVAGSSQLQAQIDVLTERIGGHQHDGSDESASFPHNNLLERDAAGAHPTIEAGVANAAALAQNAQSAAEVAGANASQALVTAQEAKAVTDAIQDGGTFSPVATNATLGQTKSLLNQIAVWINARRQV